MLNKKALRTMIAASVALVCWFQLNAKDSVITNTLSRFDVSAVKAVEFVGESSPVSGAHFTVTNRVEIEELFDHVASLTNQEMFITMCGNLTFGIFKSSNGEILATLSVNADGSTVVLRDRREGATTTLVSSDRTLSLFCFELMRRHAPDILRRIGKTSTVCGQGFPFDELDKAKP